MRGTAAACILLVVLAQVSCQDSQNVVDGLRKTLLDKYDKGTLPFVPEGLQVEFELVLTTLIDVNTAQESIEFECWWRMYWTDPRLRWDPARYDGMTQLVLANSEIWKPDVVLFEKIHDRISPTAGLQVSSTGNVLWTQQHIIKLGCPMSVEAFPYDTQICNFTIGSWTYNGEQLDVAPRNRDISSLLPAGSEVPPRSSLDLGPYTQVEPWTLEVARVLWKDTFFGCCIEPYPVLIFEFQLQRASRTIFSGVITPMLLVSFIGFVVFLIAAPASGSRPALSLRMLLTYVTVYFVASSSTPQSNKSTTIGRMYVAGIVFAGVQVIIAIVATGLNMVAPDAKGGEKWAKVFKELDTDQDGVLDQQELGRACRILGVSAEYKREILAMVDEREDGTISADQWRMLGELAGSSADRATYHNSLVQGLVKRFLRAELREPQPQPLSKLLDAAPDPLFPVYQPVDQRREWPVDPHAGAASASAGARAERGGAARAAAEVQRVHGAAFGARREEQALGPTITASDLRSRQEAKHGTRAIDTDGLASLAQKVEVFTQAPTGPARAGRQLAAHMDSWALWIMLPAYVIYIIAEFSGAWTGHVVKGHEFGFGNAPNQRNVQMEFYDYRSFGELRCYRYTPDFAGAGLGLMAQANEDCDAHEAANRSP